MISLCRGMQYRRARLGAIATVFVDAFGIRSFGLMRDTCRYAGSPYAPRPRIQPPRRDKKGNGALYRNETSIVAKFTTQMARRAGNIRPF